MQKPQLFDVVELLVDIPERGLFAGMQGAVVEIHQNGVAYEIEFTNEQSETLDFLALEPEQFVVIWKSTTQQWVPLAERVADLVERLPENAGAEVLAFARSLSARTTQLN